MKGRAAARRPAGTPEHLTDLVPDGQNRRKHTPRNIGMLVEALQKVGAARSIVIDEKGQVLAGNGVVEAAAAAGLTKVRVIDAKGDEVVAVRRTGLSAAQKRDLAIYDNRVAELAEWSVEQLLKDQAEGLDLQPFFTDEELAGVLGSKGPKAGRTDPDDVPERRATDIRPGDLFELGKHRLICGDCTKAEDTARLMAGDVATVLLTDPPYGMNLDTDWSDVVGSLSSIGGKHRTAGNKYAPVIGDDKPFDPSHLFAAFPQCREMFLWGADYYAERIQNRTEGSWLVWDKRKESQADAIGAEFELCWSKAKHKRRILRHDWFGFLSSQNGADARHRVHPTQKPVSLMVDMFLQWGKAGDVVADVYGGSGSTLVGCERVGYGCRLMELSPPYVQVIIDRWEAFTGQKAKKVGEAVRA